MILPVEEEKKDEPSIFPSEQSTLSFLTLNYESSLSFLKQIFKNFSHNNLNKKSRIKKQSFGLWYNKGPLEDRFNFAEKTSENPLVRFGRSAEIHTQFFVFMILQGKRP